MAEALGRILPALPATLTTTETQALIVAALCFIGSWVLVSKIIQFVFSMIWPFLLVGAFLTVAPHWTNTILSETIPQYLQILHDNFKKAVQYVTTKRDMNKEER